MEIQFQHKSCSCFILAFCTAFQQEKGTSWSTELFCWVSLPLLNCQARWDLKMPLGKPGSQILGTWQTAECLVVSPSPHSIALKLLVCKSRWEIAVRSRLLQGQQSVNILQNAPRDFQRLSSPWKSFASCKQTVSWAWILPHVLAIRSHLCAAHCTRPFLSPFLLPLFSSKSSLFWPTFKIPNESQLSTELNMQPRISMQMKSQSNYIRARTSIWKQNDQKMERNPSWT